MKGFYIMMLAGCALNMVFTLSCSKVPTYEELKAAEKKVIKKIIAEREIEVLKEYPADGIFGANQFVELNSGIYLNVVDSGNGKRAQLNSTILLVRASGYLYDADTAVYFNTFSSISYPFEFKYGYAYSVVSEKASSFDAYYYYFGMGMESIMEHVGEGAVVKMIVPGYAEIRSVPAGSYYQTANQYRYYPIYYDKVSYSFY